MERAMRPNSDGSGTDGAHHWKKVASFEDVDHVRLRARIVNPSTLPWAIVFAGYIDGCDGPFLARECLQAGPFGSGGTRIRSGSRRGEAGPERI